MFGLSRGESGDWIADVQDGEDGIIISGGDQRRETHGNQDLGD